VREKDVGLKEARGSENTGDIKIQTGLQEREMGPRTNGRFDDCKKEKGRKKEEHRRGRAFITEISSHR